MGGRMELPKGNELSDSSEEDPHIVTEDERLEQGLERLWHVCNVLGILYKTKIAEFGSVLSEERVNEALRFLTLTRDTNFFKLKEISEELTEAWRLCNTNMSKVQSFSWIFLIQEAENPEEIIHWSVLSTDHVAKADAEVCRLVKEREKKIQKKYDMKKLKLKRLLAESHLTAADVQFDMNEKVTAESYRFQKDSIKDAIRAAKESSGKRKELVVRVEMARKAMHDKNLSGKDRIAMISYALKAVGRVKSSGESLQYDGQNIEDILKAFLTDAQELNEAETLSGPNVTETLSWTRSGRTARRE